MMKFIFPQNYRFHTKLFGFIDYSTAIFNIVIWIIYFAFAHVFLTDISVKVIVFITICFPLFLLSIIGFQHENLLYIFSYLFLFFKNRKVYLYRKIE